MNDPIKRDVPPKPLGKPVAPGKPPLFKDRRAHRIELRNKVSEFKEEIKELKAIKTEDESKQNEIQNNISTLMTRLKECEMEKESIEQFNHTQFVKNVEKSRDAESRFDKESHGKNNFFENQDLNIKSEIESENTGSGLQGDGNSELIDENLLKEEHEISSSDLEVQPINSPADEEKSKEIEPEDLLPPIELPPNTIV